MDSSEQLPYLVAAVAILISLVMALQPKKAAGAETKVCAR